MVRAGDMFEIITIQQPIETVTNGDLVTTWQTITAQPAAVMTTGGMEVYRGRQLRADVTHLVTTIAAGLVIPANPTWRILWGTRELNIVSVINVDNRNRQIEFLCRERL